MGKFTLDFDNPIVLYWRVLMLLPSHVVHLQMRA